MTAAKEWNVSYQGGAIALGALRLLCGGLLARVLWILRKMLLMSKLGSFVMTALVIHIVGFVSDNFARRPQL
jgi:hypothetical protein